MLCDDAMVELIPVLTKHRKALPPKDRPLISNACLVPKTMPANWFSWDNIPSVCLSVQSLILDLWWPHILQFPSLISRPNYRSWEDKSMYCVIEYIYQWRRTLSVDNKSAQLSTSALLKHHSGRVAEVKSSVTEHWSVNTRGPGFNPYQMVWNEGL